MGLDYAYETLSCTKKINLPAKAIIRVNPDVKTFKSGMIYAYMSMLPDLKILISLTK